MKNIDAKKQLILANETEMARQLALYVIEKPVPRVWMIFIPIFFVFYFWKLKEYENGLKDFAEHHLLLRRQALEAAFAAEESGLSVDIENMVGQVGDLPDKTRSLYSEWVAVLIGHFQLLFTAEGDSYPALVRSGYRSKSNYLLFCRQIGKTEAAYNMALLPTIEGNSATLYQVAETMTEGSKNLRSREAEEIFS